LGDEGEVLRLLDGIGTEHGPSGLPGCHDVLVVAEDGQSLGRQRAGGDMEDGAGEFTGDLVHVGDHQQEALRGREGRRERTGLEGTVDRSCGSTFRLHLDHRRYGSPKVLGTRRGPGVGPFAHGGRRGDGVDGDDFA